MSKLKTSDHYKELYQSIAAIGAQISELHRQIHELEDKRHAIYKTRPRLWYAEQKNGPIVFVHPDEGMVLDFMSSYARDKGLDFENLGLGNAYVLRLKFGGDWEWDEKSLHLSVTEPSFSDWDDILNQYLEQVKS